MSRCPESDRAYAGKLAAEDAAYRDVAADAAALAELARAGTRAAGVEHHCYLCGAEFTAPRLAWRDHEEDCWSARQAARRGDLRP